MHLVPVTTLVIATTFACTPHSPRPQASGRNAGEHEALSLSAGQPRLSVGGVVSGTFDTAAVMVSVPRRVGLAKAHIYRVQLEDLADPDELRFYTFDVRAGLENQSCVPSEVHLFLTDRVTRDGNQWNAGEELLEYNETAPVVGMTGDGDTETGGRVVYGVRRGGDFLLVVMRPHSCDEAPAAFELRLFDGALDVNANPDGTGYELPALN
ncbi:MAG: hypothetical protein AAGE52_38075 [Myxococcota bacterium]